MMAAWSRWPGRIMFTGDSITNGAMGYTGGWRPAVASALAAADLTAEYVGPTLDAYGRHRGVDGTSAFQQTIALQTDCATWGPRRVVMGYGMNDIGAIAGGGQERSAAQTLASFSTCLAWIRAGAPQATVYQTQVVRPTNAYPIYFARVAEYDALNAALPGWCAANGVIWIPLTGTPVLSDGVHPVNGATGYDLMATDIANAIIASV